MPTSKTYMRTAKLIVRNYVKRTLDKSDEKVSFDVEVVWFSKTLQNWKALVSTTLPDGRYYEITHNGDEDESYLDVYVKVDNLIIGQWVSAIAEVTNGE